MLYDDVEETRIKAGSIIVEARRRQTGTADIRVFRVPKINFEATSYTEMITWPSTPSAPPILSSLTDEEVIEIATTRARPSFTGLPCHTQAVERCVKLVTESSSAVCGEKAREGFIQCRMESRKTLPNLDTKKDFLLMFGKQMNC
ncbi:uncharacterized protein LOC127750366 [Frankliniella occidentalis]|uniref:Uncharacterized protein LOC127750366 n=1 Tax=Frankliniella occidentalis TaxID=133901 RepID=A0A9C6X2C1_FRAOC|nr:uncharacterized protein LOC127750366 [Frankliniella occidentalis]